MSIEIDEYLEVQRYGSNDKKQYVRVSIPIKYSESEDIRPHDLLKIVIVDHVKLAKRD